MYPASVGLAVSTLKSCWKGSLAPIMVGLLLALSLPEPFLYSKKWFNDLETTLPCNKIHLNQEIRDLHFAIVLYSIMVSFVGQDLSSCHCHGLVCTILPRYASPMKTDDSTCGEDATAVDYTVKSQSEFIKLFFISIDPLCLSEVKKTKQKLIMIPW